MRGLARASACLVAVALTLGAPAADADPRPMTSGGHLRPLEDVPVALDRETLTIAVELRAVKVTAALTLKNRGDEPADFRAAFPCLTNREGKGVVGVYDLGCRTRPTVRIGKKKLRARKLTPGKVAESYWAWPMSLAAGETVELVVSYSLPLVNENYGTPAHGLAALAYKLVTGATWAGPIRELNIELRLPHAAVAWIAPAGYQRQPGVIRWTLKDVEPAEDLVVFVAPGPFQDLGGDAEARHARAARLREGGERLHDFVGFFRKLYGDHYVLREPTPAEVRAVVEASAALLEPAPEGPPE